MDKIFCYSCFCEKSDAKAVCPNCGYSEEQDGDRYPLALPHGTILNGRYILGRVLGQGGFGITYVAQDWKTKQLVAVKEYLPDSICTRVGSHSVKSHSGEQSESFCYGKECFLNEAKTLAKFAGHPNIVQVYSYFEENGTAYFIMDYVKGVSFQTYIQNEGGRIDWQKAQEILLPVMDALSLVHSRGVIHRDVTPDNIYITEEGTVKILDFGAARYSMGDKSRSLDIVLKHGFAPKEQYTRHGRQGAYTDIYSLAASFYYAITGRRPPDSIDRIEEDDLVSPDSLGINIPNYVEKALLKGLEVQPSDRFQNMEQFKIALSGGMQKKYEDTDSVSREYDSIPPVQMDFTQQPPSQAAGAETVIQYSKEEAPFVKPEMKIWKQKWFIPIFSGVAVLFVIAGGIIAVLSNKNKALKEKESQQQTASENVVEEGVFLNLDDVSKNDKEEEQTVELTDSYEDLYWIFGRQSDLIGEKELLFFLYDDFDNDGTHEAFGIIGISVGLNLYDDVDIYFVSSDGEIKNIRPEQDFYGYLGEMEVDVGEEKFIVWELSAGDIDSVSYVFGVKDGMAYEPNISRRCMEFGPSEYRDLYSATILDWSDGVRDYITEYYLFDVETHSFVVTENLYAVSREARYYCGVEFYDDYVLEDSDKRYYDKYELKNLGLEQLKIARNEIYARHGRRFLDAELQSYFDACSWYIGTIEPEDFDQEKIFNEYEKANVLVLKECEEKLGN